MTGSQQLILGEGAGGSGVANYIEDVFSTYLYTGTNAAQTITNGIDLSTYGGLVWTKSRDDGSLYHVLSDSATGPNNILRTNSSNAPFTYTAAGWSVPVFNANGYTTSDSGYVTQNAGGFNKFVSWTFRKQPKFFDVVTYTGNGSDQNIAHNLGSVPGFVVIKRTNTTGNWSVWHRSIGNNYLILNTTAAQAATGNPARTVTSTTFQIYGNFPDEGANGSSYVMYLFAHDAGGFGLTGTDNVISCGSVTNTTTVNLGYEPQWIMLKRTDSTSPWYMIDNMRGMDANYDDNYLAANSSAAEALGGLCALNATGMTLAVAGTYIYIAIRRGPMKTPTTGTSVFDPVLLVNGSTNLPPVNSTINAPDLAWSFARNAVYGYGSLPRDRLSSAGISYLETSSTAAEVSYAGNTFGFTRLQKGIDGANAGSTFNQASPGTIYWMFGRAPGFFDLVCYTGTSSVRTVSHNLGVAPELLITKSRSTSGTNWSVYSRFTSTTYGYQTLQTDSAGNSARTYGPGGSPNFEELSAAPTASVINLASSGESNFNGRTFVAYLFASCPGVSKVGTYTGTGALQTINCGFTGGARFVLIKRTDNNGDWFVYDSTRGITSGNDPYLLMNSATAEVTGTNYVDTTSVGFQVTAAAPAGLNANGGTYIFLAIA